MKNVRLFAEFTFAFAVLLGSGCSDTDEMEHVIHADAVQLDKTEISLVIGASELLTATVLPEDAADKRVEWSVSDPSVATVDDSGLVTAVEAGTATVTVTTVDGGKTDVCEVEVTSAVYEPVLVTGVSLDKTEISLEVGSSELLTATVLPEDAADKRVEWSVSDPSVVTVDDRGLVTAIEAGTATVTVTTVDGGKTAVCEVEVTAATLRVIAEGDTGSLHWVLTEDGLLSFSGTGDIPDYNAMSMGADRPWTQYKDRILKVDLPDGITRIGVFAFAECKALKTMSIPASVASLGDYAFAASGLERISLPGSVRTIAPGAFTNCLSLSAVGFEGEGLKTIGDNAFSASAIESIDLPDGVVAIGASAFHNCQLLRRITIPGSVTEFGRKPFEGCVDLAVTISDGMTAIADELFYDCTGLKSVSIPGSVERIGVSAFRDCSNLQEAVLPQGVKSIESYAFNGCGALAQIDIPASVQSIGELAFSASGLTSIRIPEGTVSIGERAFFSCRSLTQVVLSDSLEKMDVSVFSECGALKSVAFGKGISMIPDSTFAGTGVETISIPQNIESIGKDAFSGCTLLSVVDMGTGVRSIGTSAFRWCDALLQITVPANVETIGDLAFANCANLSEVTLGENLKSFEMMTFSNCSALIKVTCLAIVPPLHSTMIAGISMNFPATNDTLYVPVGSKEAYQADIDWGKTFTTILEIE